MPIKIGGYFDNKGIRIEYDIDASKRITAIRRVGTKPLTVLLTRSDGTKPYTLASNATSLSIPTTTANRIQLTFVSARNRYTGMAGEIREA